MGSATVDGHDLFLSRFIPDDEVFAAEAMNEDVAGLVGDVDALDVWTEGQCGFVGRGHAGEGELCLTLESEDVDSEHSVSCTCENVVDLGVLVFSGTWYGFDRSYCVFMAIISSTHDRTNDTLVRFRSIVETVASFP